MHFVKLFVFVVSSNWLFAAENWNPCLLLDDRLIPSEIWNFKYIFLRIGSRVITPRFLQSRVLATHERNELTQQRKCVPEANTINQAMSTNTSSLECSSSD